MKTRLFCWLALGMCMGIFHPLNAQENIPKQHIPPILMVRGEESYATLRNDDSTQFFLRGLKFISLNSKKSVFLTMGGEYRGRVEHFTNENYTPTDRTYYSQRLSLHAGLTLGPSFRIFTELYHGATSEGQILLQSDVIDFHQAFFEWTFGKKDKAPSRLRLGRQEIGFGTSRLVGIREGPNMRRSFDMVRWIIPWKKSSLNIVYGREVNMGFAAFDNVSQFFEPNQPNPTLWAIYYQRPLFKNVGKLDLYYFGFHSNTSRFNDVLGEELRHSLGARSFGKAGNLTYNTEVILQFGNLGDSQILAYDFETDWTYQLTPKYGKPTVGLRLDWSSGDRQAGDGTIGTFNPFFVNPAIYSLAAVNTPANILSFHPNLQLTPCNKFSIYMDYALFYRTQSGDGLYSPPRFLFRGANGITEKHVGDVFGIQLTYQATRNITLDVRSSYFIAGRFIEQTGPSENTFYVAPTVSLKF